MSESEKSSNVECKAVNVNTFYGTHFNNPLRTKETSKNPVVIRKPLPRRLDNLLGPTQVWKVFQRQQDALECAKVIRSGVMTFAFQQLDGVRSFLVAHPQIFWHYDVQKNASERCTYEIIPETSACKLYFDIEFDIKCNPEKSGPLCIDTFISVVVYFLATLFNIKATRQNILDLDSSTDKKFSRHLIFQLDSNVFHNNKSVGAFVHFICQKLLLYLSSFHGDTVSEQQIVCKCCQLLDLKNTGCVKDIGLSLHSLQNLVILDRKGHKCLICDESVYSRNRHFRIFQNKKWGKNSPLLLSKDNLYIPFLQPGGKGSDEILYEAIFLDSLITNFRFQEKNVRDIKVIHFNSSLTSKVDKSTNSELSSRPLSDSVSFSETVKTSPYPEVDKFINSLVFPGHIWRSAYFSSSSVIVYDIVANRYCQNIGRQHRSNNVKFIVNLDNYTYYQKCHDTECSLFRSNPLALPVELKFKLEDGCFICDFGESSKHIDFSLSDSDLMEAVNVIEDLSFVHPEESS